MTNRHDLDAIMAAFSDNCVFESPRGPDLWGKRFAGKSEVRNGLAARFTGTRMFIRRRRTLRRVATAVFRNGR